MQKEPSAPHTDGARLVVVSNRVALPDGETSGGLAVALRAALSECGGTWVGWSGERTRAGIDPVRAEQDGRVRYVLQDLDADEIERYYLGYANRVLWPLLHSRLDLVQHDPDEQRAWLAVNRRFADRVARETGPGDLVWVHDYHLIPVARDLRRRGLRNRIAFFLHTPVPAPDILRTLPDHARLLPMLRDYDLVGVQTRAARDHLREYFAHADDGFDAARVRDYPIGIDVDHIAALAAAANDRAETRELRHSLGNRHLILGVDRLDYSKGLLSRFGAYERLLSTHPELHGRFSYLQIAPGSRSEVPEYEVLREEVEREAGRINGRFGDVDWTPLRYVGRGFPIEVLAGYYRAARVGLVTPLRDGMNLVAKEYVAAQDPDDPGVLVLSEFAGAAEHAEGALLVNPLDGAATAEAVAQALKMPRRERVARWQRLLQQVRETSLQRWTAAMLGDLRQGDAHSVPKATNGRRPAGAAPA